nr:immunoglobulin light chain junction region [Macaca mulatta]
CLQTNSPWTF